MPMGWSFREAEKPPESLHCLWQKSPRAPKISNPLIRGFLETPPPPLPARHVGDGEISLKSLSIKLPVMAHLLLGGEIAQNDVGQGAQPASGSARETTSKASLSIKGTASPDCCSQSHFQHSLLWLMIRSPG